MTINISSEKMYRPTVITLLVLILGFLTWSLFWTTNTAADRTITVSAEAIVEAEPDEFVFSPYFEDTGIDREAVRHSLIEQANNLVAALKELGVEESQIKLDASSYDRWYWSENETGTMTIQLTIKLLDGELVQEVQDYLTSIDVKGQISPRASFSNTMRDELNASAFTQASEKAKQKAEDQASLFDAKLGKVISISQDYEDIFGYDYPVSDMTVAEELEATASSLPVLPGRNELTQRVTVVYELR